MDHMLPASTHQVELSGIHDNMMDDDGNQNNTHGQQAVTNAEDSDGEADPLSDGNSSVPGRPPPLPLMNNTVSHSTGSSRLFDATSAPEFPIASDQGNFSNAGGDDLHQLVRAENLAGPPEPFTNFIPPVYPPIQQDQLVPPVRPEDDEHDDSREESGAGASRLLRRRLPLAELPLQSEPQASAAASQTLLNAYES